jgi:hypothetical protein
MQTTLLTSHKRNDLVKSVLGGGAIAGTLDIISAFIYTSVYGRQPDFVLKYIASGVLGNEAFNGGTATVLLGLAIHYIIAFCWTILFFVIYPRLKFL